MGHRHPDLKIPNIKINYTVIGGAEFNVDDGVGVAYDQVRGSLFLKGDATLWRLTPPDVMGPDGWVMEKIIAGGDTPIDANSTGIWGSFTICRMKMLLLAYPTDTRVISGYIGQGKNDKPNDDDKYE
ncbi:MAG: hypothetical protein IPG64_06200 [Haliea sp.]|nr:hypothetical protein [Haliea sp.]